jgi:hypothetical protein
VVPSLGPWSIGTELEGFAATPARVGCFPLLTMLIYVADEHPS